jgi:hypothetical protein
MDVEHGSGVATDCTGPKDPVYAEYTREGTKEKKLQVRASSILSPQYLQCSAVQSLQCSAVQCLQCSAVQCLQCDELKCKAVATELLAIYLFPLSRPGRTFPATITGKGL